MKQVKGRSRVGRSIDLKSAWSVGLAVCCCKTPAVKVLTYFGCVMQLIHVP